MERSVKRRYDSTHRQEQARQTKREILRAAHDLFVAKGFGATTMNEVAAAAGVSVETIYSAYGSKLNVLKRVWDVTIGGDDEEVPFYERPEVLAMRAEKNLARRLEMYAELIAHHVGPRTSPFVEAMRGAATVHPEARAMLEEMDRQRLNGMTIAARELAEGEGLAVSQEEARDVLWSTNPGDLWRLLVQERGWSNDRFAIWLGNLWKRMLLESNDR
jgi:AcrR family transcriptional regulator